MRTNSRALVFVDDAPLRTAASAKFRQLYRRYLRRLAELADHEEKVRPAYFKWLFEALGSHLKALKELEAAVVRQSQLLYRMLELHMVEGMSRRTAFEQANEEQQFEFDLDEDADSDEDDANSHDHESAHEDDAWNKGRSSRNEDEFGRFGLSANRTDESEKSEEEQIKSFYRKLAQALHPDVVGEETELSKELWQETQDAYKARDLEQLKLLWTMVSLQKESLSREIRLFDLQAAVSHMKAKLDKVEKEKRRLARNDPSWGFDKKDKQRLAAELRSDMAKQESELRSTLDEVGDQLRYFKSSGRKRRESRYSY